MLAELSLGKKVLHIGCCDHEGLIINKKNTNTYLHDILKRSAKKLDGVDTNESGINFMKQLGYEDIYLPSQVVNKEYDLVVIADVIEHVPNVEKFLLEMKNYKFTQMVITTPNAFRLKNRTSLTSECINTDHRYWFSPFTLAKLLVQSGFKIELIKFTDIESKINIFRNMILKKYPLMQDGLLFIMTI